MRSDEGWALPMLFLLARGAKGRAAKEEMLAEKQLSGWYTFGGVCFGYEGQGEKSNLGLGLSRRLGIMQKSYPQALGLHVVNDWSREKVSASPRSLDAFTVRAEAFLLSFAISRCPLGVSFDSSIPLALRVWAKGAESIHDGRERVADSGVLSELKCDGFHDSESL